MTNAEGFILAGGASSRMGRDKAVLELGSIQFVKRIADSLSPITRRVVLVGPERTGPLNGFPRVSDVYPGWGALGGLHAALHACREGLALIVACDLPFVTADLFSRLISLLGDYDAVIPVQSDGRLQPLCAVYRPLPCTAVTEQLIETGERRPRALLDLVNARRVGFQEIAGLPNSELFFFNVNTPEDYLLAQRSVTGGTEPVV